MAKNHLIIGLGGSGGKILRELRKRVYEELKTDVLTDPIVLDYLYVDSSPADLNDKANWKTMGHSVHLREAQKVSIHGINAGVLNNLHQTSGISAFLTPEDRNLMQDISAVVSAGIGGQRRRLGRLLFANNLNINDGKNFNMRLIERVNAMTHMSGEHKVTFHVCAGLAGGTGSGSFVDVVAQIRKLFAPQIGLGDQYKLVLYLYVPEIILANPKMDSGYYQANGYAALMELNAMSVNAYHPHDVTGQLDKNGNICRLLQNCNAFETAYLFSNINEAGKQLDINTTLPAAVADFIFQKNIASYLNGGGRLSRLITCENEDPRPESDAIGTPVHSRRFMSFGVKRIEYPETEIKEYFSANYARQAALQLQYNLWQDGIGFGECSIDEVGLGYKSEIEDKKTLEKLLLSNAYLTLSKPIVEHQGTKRWKEIVTGWEALVQHYKEDAMTDKEKKNWFSNFTRDCELQFNTNYRGHGVKEFYKIQQGEKNGYAAHIRRHIEKMLFDDWHSGTRSILEVEKYVALLIGHCDKRIAECNDKVGKYESVIEHEINPAIKDITNEWNNIGWLRDAITNVSTKVLGKYAEAKRDLYTHKTLIEGYSYAKDLLQAIKIELDNLYSQIQAFRLQLTELLKRVTDEANSKCNDNGEGDDKIVKKYDPNLVHQIMKNFITDKDRQKANASDIRNEWVKLLGEDAPHSFQALLDRVDLSSLEDLFTKVCMKSSTVAMEDWANGNSGQKLLNVNIVEKIKNEYNSDDLLETFIKNLVQTAKCYLQFNPAEMASPNPEYAATRMMSMIQLCIPKYEDPTNFRQKFIDMFALCCPGFSPTTDVAENYKSSQIVVIAAASAFPLRYVANVANLKTVYESKLIGPQADLNKMVMFTETHAQKLPELFAKSKEDMVEELVPTLLLAFGMGLPVRKEDPVTGGKFYAIGFEDEFGDLGDWIKLGKNIFQAVETLTASESDAKKISELVQSKLKSDYRHNEKKTVLRKAIASFVKEHVLPLCGGNDMDERYLAYKTISRALFDKELKLED